MVVGIRVAAPAAKAQIVDPLRKGGDEMVEKEQQDERDRDPHQRLGRGRAPLEEIADRVQKRLQPLGRRRGRRRSEEHTSELQSLMRISYAVFCLKKKKKNKKKLMQENTSATQRINRKH